MSLWYYNIIVSGTLCIYRILLPTVYKYMFPKIYSNSYKYDLLAIKK